MAGMGACCLSGSIHAGTPTGREDTIGGLPVYIAEPADKSPAKSVIFVTDVFGWKFQNVRLMADDFAKAGFYCYIPDVQEGDSLDIGLLKSIEPPLKAKEQEGLIDKAKETVDVMAILGPWLGRHREAVAEPIISGFVNAVKHIPGTNKVGAIGFCWGGRYAILQAHGRKEGEIGGVDAAFAAHPSLLAIPSDLTPVTKPTSVAVGEKDSYLDMKSVEQLRDELQKTGAPSEVQVYNDQVHGFALRSDWSSDADRKAMDDAEKQAINWFKKYLA